MSLFSLADVTRGYDRRTVLDIPKLDIEENRIHALLGPNGAGKTTLLNILGFLEPPTTGEIHFRSKPVRFIEAELQQLRRSAVLVDQHPILFSTTVYKNLEFGLKIRGIAPGGRSRGSAPNLVYHHGLQESGIWAEDSGYTSGRSATSHR